MPYKLRGNKRRSKAAWRNDYKHKNKSQKWEAKKKTKKKYARKSSSGMGLFR